MGIDISIRDVPVEQIERLRLLARRHGRSLEDELKAMIADTARSSPRRSLEEIDARLAARGFSTPDEATAWLREDRDR